MTHFFKDCYRVAGFNRILPQVDQFFEKLINVGEIEITCNHKVFGHPVVFPDKWMDAVAESNPTVSLAKYILEGVYTNEVIVKEVRRLRQQK